MENQYQIKFKAGNSNIIPMNVTASSFKEVIEKVEENFTISEIKGIKMEIPNVSPVGDLFNQSEQSEKQSNTKTKTNEKA